jgi:hypothetical protein
MQRIRKGTRINQETAVISSDWGRHSLYHFQDLILVLGGHEIRDVLIEIASAETNRSEFWAVIGVDRRLSRPIMGLQIQLSINRLNRVWAGWLERVLLILENMSSCFFWPAPPST